MHRRHFHTFDALRFFAFLKVFLLHVPIIGFACFSFLKAGGGIGVQFFFVLSGFLITYIILEEKRQTGSLGLRNFFARRILRIWPLYYLMVAVAYSTPWLLSHLVALPSSSEGYTPKLWASLLFLENYMGMATHQHANVSPLSIMWTLCIEEHFYIVWGLLLCYTPIRRLPSIIICPLLLAPVLRAVYVHYNVPTADLFTNIDLFAWGALPAYYLAVDPAGIEAKVMKIPLNLKRMFLVVLLVAVVICSQFAGSEAAFILLTSLMGMLFSALIFIILPGDSPIKIKEGNILSRLGMYTYGLYLYHVLVIIALQRIFTRGGWEINTATGAIAFVCIALLLSVISSYLSYHLFEKHFLKLKKYFRK